MRLILARHGNTFGPSDKVVWAGTTNDLPLVESGLKQAQKAADYFLEHKIVPKAIYCSPLQRTRRFAEIIIERLNLNYKPIVDSRLSEIDYGQWTGLSDEEIIQRFGADEFKRWGEQSEWPYNSSWGGTEYDTIKDVYAFADDLESTYSTKDTVVAVTSNGRLRYFLMLIEGEFEKRRQEKRLKVKTGNLCEISLNNGFCALNFWDKDPGAK